MPLHDVNYWSTVGAKDMQFTDDANEIDRLRQQEMQLEAEEEAHLLDVSDQELLQQKIENKDRLKGAPARVKVIQKRKRARMQVKASFAFLACSFVLTFVAALGFTDNLPFAASIAFATVALTAACLELVLGGIEDRHHMQLVIGGLGLVMGMIATVYLTHVRIETLAQEARADEPIAIEQLFIQQTEDAAIPQAVSGEAADVPFIEQNKKVLTVVFSLLMISLDWTAGACLAFGHRNANDPYADAYDRDAEIEMRLKNNARRRVGLKRYVERATVARRLAMQTAEMRDPELDRQNRIAIWLGVIAVVVLVILLFATGAFAAEIPSSGRHIVIALDVSDSQEALFERNKLSIARLLGAADFSDHFTVLAINEASYSTPPLLTATVTASGGFMNERIRQARQSLVSQWARVSSVLRPTSKETHVMEALFIASSIFSDKGCADVPGTCQLYIFSDLLEYSKGGIILDTMHVPDVAALMKRATSQRLVAELNGVHVYAAGVSSNRPIQVMLAIRGFWDQYFVASGATLKYITPLSTLPDVR